MEMVGAFMGVVLLLATCCVIGSLFIGGVGMVVEEGASLSFSLSLSPFVYLANTN